jgi:hypothetical protein
MSEEARDENDFTVLRPHSAPEGRASHETVKTDAENVGEGAGTFLGGVTGAAFGVVGGPVGLVLGAIAGALGGWWAGRGVADAFTSQDEAFYRAQYEGSPTRLADRDYETVSPAYVAGHLAGRNPDYAGRSFEDVEDDLRKGWTDDVSKQHGQWSAVRGFARAAFEHARGTPVVR